MKIPKIPTVKLGYVEEPGWSEIEEKKLEAIVKENRWQLGIVMMGEHHIPAGRRRSLDCYQYKIGEQVTEKVDSFMPHEYMEWRDS